MNISFRTDSRFIILWIHRVFILTTKESFKSHFANIWSRNCYTTLLHYCYLCNIYMFRAVIKGIFIIYLFERGKNHELTKQRRQNHRKENLERPNRRNFLYSERTRHLSTHIFCISAFFLFPPSKQSMCA